MVKLILSITLFNRMTNRIVIVDEGFTTRTLILPAAAMVELCRKNSSTLNMV
jgi:hypothetical protein